MTREEAIYEIKQLAVLSTDKEIPKITEALNMAIEALHREEAEENGYCHRILPSNVEIVVRCKDCNYYDESLEVCRCLQWDLSRIEYPMVGADDFCSYGERKGGEDNNA